MACYSKKNIRSKLCILKICYLNVYQWYGLTPFLIFYVKWLDLCAISRCNLHIQKSFSQSKLRPFGFLMLKPLSFDFCKLSCDVMASV